MFGGASVAVKKEIKSVIEDGDVKMIDVDTVEMS